MAGGDYGRPPQPFPHFDRRENSNLEDSEYRGAGRNHFQTGKIYRGRKGLKPGAASSLRYRYQSASSTGKPSSKPSSAGQETWQGPDRMHDQDWLGSPHEDGHNFGPGDGPGMSHGQAPRGSLPIQHSTSLL